MVPASGSELAKLCTAPGFLCDVPLRQLQQQHYAREDLPVIKVGDGSSSGSSAACPNCKLELDKDMQAALCVRLQCAFADLGNKMDSLSNAMQAVGKLAMSTVTGEAAVITGEGRGQDQHQGVIESEQLEIVRHGRLVALALKGVDAALTGVGAILHPHNLRLAAACHEAGCLASLAIAVTGVSETASVLSETAALLSETAADVTDSREQPCPEVAILLAEADSDSESTRWRRVGLKWLGWSLAALIRHYGPDSTCVAYERLEIAVLLENSSDLGLRAEGIRQRAMAARVLLMHFAGGAEKFVYVAGTSLYD